MLVNTCILFFADFLNECSKLAIHISSHPLKNSPWTKNLATSSTYPSIRHPLGRLRFPFPAIIQIRILKDNFYNHSVQTASENGSCSGVEMAGLESHNGYYLWHYVPNIAAAVIFIVVFAIVTGAHVWRMVQTRLWFCLPFVIGGVCKSYPSSAMSTIINHTLSNSSPKNSRSGRLLRPSSST